MKCVRRRMSRTRLLVLCALLVVAAWGAPHLCRAGARKQIIASSSTGQRAVQGIQRLQSWYDPATGLYRSTGWWNAANAMTTLADYTRATGDKQYLDVISNTFHAAQLTSPGFLNNFYDDEGWWALAWIDVYDLTGRKPYLRMAQSIFSDMAGGWDDTCSGGIWWSKDRKYKNAIANELFLSVAAHLLARSKDKRLKDEYRSWALRENQWFFHSGMINSDHLVNDGLDAHCGNNGQTVWSYNQAVIVGGLSELYRITRDEVFLGQASAIAGAVLSSPALVDSHDILHDACEPTCGADGTQFKGIYMRNLAALQRISPSPSQVRFILANSDSIAGGMQTPDHSIGAKWTAPYGAVNASTQSSGEDALIAALCVGKQRRRP